MKQLLNTLLQTGRACGLAVLALAARLLRWLPTASWQRILVLCLLVALVLAVLPLALMLFVAFFMIKLVMLALVVPAPRQLECKTIESTNKDEQ